MLSNYPETPLLLDFTNLVNSDKESSLSQSILPNTRLEFNEAGLLSTTPYNYFIEIYSPNQIEASKTIGLSTLKPQRYRIIPYNNKWIVSLSLPPSEYELIWPDSYYRVNGYRDEILINKEIDKAYYVRYYRWRNWLVPTGVSFTGANLEQELIREEYWWVPPIINSNCVQKNYLIVTLNSLTISLLNYPQLKYITNVYKDKGSVNDYFNTLTPVPNLENGYILSNINETGLLEDVEILNPGSYYLYSNFNQWKPTYFTEDEEFILSKTLSFHESNNELLINDGITTEIGVPEEIEESAVPIVGIGDTVVIEYLLPIPLNSLIIKNKNNR
jgi:hypothetical protein